MRSAPSPIGISMRLTQQPPASANRSAAFGQYLGTVFGFSTLLIIMGVGGKFMMFQTGKISKELLDKNDAVLETLGDMAKTLEDIKLILDSRLPNYPGHKP